MRPSELATRKKELLQQLNGFMDMKKQHAVSVQNRIALIGSKGAPAEEPKHSRYDGESKIIVFNILPLAYSDVPVSSSWWR